MFVLLVGRIAYTPTRKGVKCLAYLNEPVLYILENQAISALYLDEPGFYYVTSRQDLLPYPRNDLGQVFDG